MLHSSSVTFQRPQCLALKETVLLEDGCHKLAVMSDSEIMLLVPFQCSNMSVMLPYCL